MKGTIYLVPVTLGNPDFHKVLSDHVIETAKSLRYFVVEEVRSARRFLRLIDKSFPIDDTRFFELNEHTRESEIAEFIEPVLTGADLGLMSEAGLPGIADPGMLLVRLAHNRGIRVVPLSGPSSLLLALAASGLNGQNFVFHGYLPQKQAERSEKLRVIEMMSLSGQSQIFMETPYRAQKMAGAILSECRPETLLCVACDITLDTEEIRTMKVDQWRKDPPRLEDRLVIFILGR